MAISNIKDIIAFGFDPEKTFIFLDTEYIKELYPNVTKVQKAVTLNQIKGVFGFNDSDPVGKYAYPPIQAVPSFCNSFPHIFGSRKNVPSLIPCAIDQDPYFRMTRDVAARLKYEKTGTFYSTFFPGLEGMKGKMSSSSLHNTILLTDSAADVKKKINKYAFSGGGATEQEQREKGANLDVDMPYQYLRFFLEDDAELAQIAEDYSTGKMLTGQIKQKLIEVLSTYLKEFQERRKAVTDEDVKKFMEVRKINPVPKKFEEARKAKEAAEKAAKEAEAGAGAQ
jgi:tryptophanyl-tRNA synthetase